MGATFGAFRDLTMILKVSELLPSEMAEGAGRAGGA
jgi:hypothetical protein